MEAEDVQLDDKDFAPICYTLKTFIIKDIKKFPFDYMK